MKSLVLFSALLTLSLLTACNTVEGLGQDIKRGGEAIQNASK
ncbi:MAG: entericidin A/B family lipoprotein [Pseudomonadota bacterium]